MLLLGTSSCANAVSAAAAVHYYFCCCYEFLSMVMLMVMKTRMMTVLVWGIYRNYKLSCGSNRVLLESLDISVQGLGFRRRRGAFRPLNAKPSTLALLAGNH